MATVWIPAAWQDHTGGKQLIQIPGATIRQIINNLDAAYPGMKELLMEDGAIKPDIAVAVDGELARLGLLEDVGENSEVQFLPAIAGG
ncbi:MAG TPA: MoaD/ThiS family protein [Dehalococcoidia bacterium]|nr:MoaD/ThiS family protein [Dehalococcoidia bacterium]